MKFKEERYDLDLELYPIKVTYVFTNDVIKSRIKTKRLPKYIGDYQVPGLHSNSIKHPGHHWIFLDTSNGDDEMNITLSHEVFHCTVQIMRYLGVKLTPSSEEAYAYLQSYLFKAAYKNI